MADDFENHCWKDIVPPDVLDIYSHYERKIFVGPTPALLAIDLYEFVYPGRAEAGRASLHKTYPSSCGEYAHAAIEPTKRLFAAARAAGLPIFYSTQDTRPRQPAVARHRDQAPAACRTIPRSTPSSREFKPQPGDVVITKQRASGLLRHAADGASDAARHPDPDRLRREHVGLRARVRRSTPIPTASMSCWWRNAASTAACCRTRSICSTCITNMPT